MIASFYSNQTAHFAFSGKPSMWERKSGNCSHWIKQGSTVRTSLTHACFISFRIILIKQFAVSYKRHLWNDLLLCLLMS